MIIIVSILCSSSSSSSSNIITIISSSLVNIIVRPRQARPQWKASEIQANQLTCALSNEIFKAVRDMQRHMRKYAEINADIRKICRETCRETCSDLRSVEQDLQGGAKCGRAELRLSFFKGLQFEIPGKLL